MRSAALTTALAASALLGVAVQAQGLILNLGPESIVQAAGVDLQVSGYSVPCFADWNDDGLPDLLVGEGGGAVMGSVQLYLNVGVPGAPAFADHSPVQAGGADLTVPGEGCLGAFPRVVRWNDDLLPDLLVGDAIGQVTLFLNEGAPGAPVLAAGQLLRVGPFGGKVPVDVGYRATPIYQDWDADGRRDLIVGALDGRLHLFANSGTDTEPDFQVESFAQAPAGDLIVSSLRSSPALLDLNEDGCKDLLTGNTAGEILVYPNTGSDSAPIFGDFTRVAAAGVPIDFEGTPRTRPFLCDWTGDGWLDLVTGLGDGRVHLFQGGATDVAALAPPARLGLPWPNPANPRLNVDLSVARPGVYQVRVLAPSGRAVVTLFAGEAAPGRLQLYWDGRDAGGQPAASGLYLLELRGDAAAAQKLTLLR